MGKRPQISFIYFDLGSVLLPLDKPATLEMLRKVSGLSHKELHEIIVHDHPDSYFDKIFWGAVLDFDRGAIYPQEFFERTCKRLKLETNFEHFVEIWQSMLTLDRALLAVIVELRKRGIRTGVISDLCLIHFNRFRELGLSDYFDIMFFSFMEGRLKRENNGATFARALAAANLAPENILFADDRRVNITAAQQHGLRTHLYTDLQRFLQCLKRFGIQ